VRGANYWFNWLRRKIRCLLTYKRYEIVTWERIRKDLEALPKEESEAVLKLLKEAAENPPRIEKLPTEEEFKRLPQGLQQAIMNDIKNFKEGIKDDRTK